MHAFQDVNLHYNVAIGYISVQSGEYGATRRLVRQTEDAEVTPVYVWAGCPNHCRLSGSQVTGRIVKISGPGLRRVELITNGPKNN